MRASRARAKTDLLSYDGQNENILVYCRKFPFNTIQFRYQN